MDRGAWQAAIYGITELSELKQGSRSHTRAIVRVRGETFKAEQETADL